jgi:serine/threonine protein kinase
MSYCLNPRCPKPQNTNDGKFCLSCGSKLLLKERYRAIRPIGQGGFGRTFLAIDEDKPSKPCCVIKQFYPQAQGTNTLEKAIELFNQEAMRLEELGEHPQIPNLLAYFTQDNRQYLVQQFIDGQNLGQELAENGAFDETRTRHLLNDLLPVLQFYHGKQVIHRDIKPENIIRRRQNNQLVLVDFGASKVVTNVSVNAGGTSIGSPEYVAPEQIRGNAFFASDIYSLAATCVKLLTERSPFDSYDINTDTWMWERHLQYPVSGEFSRILNKMLATAPAHRYQSAEAVLHDLNQLTQIRVVPPAPIKSVTQVPPSSLPTVTSKSQSQIERELEEIQTLFMGGVKPPANSNKNQPQPPQLPPNVKNRIDHELEELRKKYLGNNPPPNE